MPRGQYDHKSGFGSSAGHTKNINNKKIKNWITLPQGKVAIYGPNKSTDVVLGQGRLMDYSFPYTHKKTHTNEDGRTYNPGEDEMIILYDYLNNAKIMKAKKLEKLNYAKMIKEKELEKQRLLGNTTTTYSCPACGNAIKKTDTRCSKCKVLMDWT